MSRIIKLLPAAALSFGPCAAYLVWAITRRKPVHTAVAVLANIVLWSAGPALLALQLKGLS